MRNFIVAPQGLTESDTLPQALPSEGFLWLSFSRREFELLQHEVDHLDGILAVSRAVWPRAFALRSERHHLTV